MWLSLRLFSCALTRRCQLLLLVVFVFVISRACFSSQTLKTRAFLFFFVCAHVRESWSRAFLAWTVETRDKHREVTDSLLQRRLLDLHQKTFFREPCIFCEESRGKINAKDVELFRNGWVHEFYHLKALIALEQVNTSIVEKSRIFVSKTLMGR